MRNSVKTLAAATLAAATFAVVPAASAETSNATVEVQAGVLSVAPGAANLNAVTTANSAGTTSGTMTVNIDDARGTSAGWNVSQNLSAGVSTTDATGAVVDTIAGSNFTATATAVTKSAGIDAAQTADLIAKSSAVDLGVGGIVLAAAQGEGEGAYAGSLKVDMTVPAYQPTGTYTGTLVTTVAAL